MQRLIFLWCTVVAAAPAAGQEPLGIYYRWGTFTQAGTSRCYAISKALPAAGQRPGRPYASVLFSPRQGPSPQFYVRLSDSKRPGSAAILRIDDNSFQLVGRGIHAWAPSPAADAAIVAAMRTGVALSVETRSERGARVRDRYLLRGAASAVDAAALACAASRR